MRTESWAFLPMCESTLMCESMLFVERHMWTRHGYLMRALGNRWLYYVASLAGGDIKMFSMFGRGRSSVCWTGPRFVRVPSCYLLPRRRLQSPGSKPVRGMRRSTMAPIHVRSRIYFRTVPRIFQSRTYFSTACGKTPHPGVGNKR